MTRRSEWRLALGEHDFGMGRQLQRPALGDLRDGAAVGLDVVYGAVEHQPLRMRRGGLQPEFDHQFATERDAGRRHVQRCAAAQGTAQPSGLQRLRVALPHQRAAGVAQQCAPRRAGALQVRV